MKITKLLIFTLVVLAISFSACEEDNTYWDDLIQAEIDAREAYIKDYEEKNDTTLTPTASGLYYIETETGTGVQAEAGKTVVVNYEGQLLDGTVFDSSWDRGSPFEFTLGQGDVIAGWDEGIAYMKEGGRAMLIIPSELAYGAGGSGSIPPYSTLVFYVQLIDVK
ncbi:MAG: FKBP-type peptidyl-prolyl cis-trans isomerase [Bacteroidales bacterium]|nr:FKBP-type peptidyl-prolyl cis-trans isomerase [Bacteroidales bacterium]